MAAKLSARRGRVAHQPTGARELAAGAAHPLPVRQPQEGPDAGTGEALLECAAAVDWRRLLRGDRSMDERRSARLHLRATGRSARRCSASTACSETATCALVRE